MVVVAQLVRALDCGSRGRGFKSRLPPKIGAALQRAAFLFMAYQVYILHNKETGAYYIGSTQNVEARLERHNRGYERATKSGAPNWVLAYQEEYATRSEAFRRERQVKGRKSRAYIERLISGDG